jgi:hypothetical protein
MSWDSEVAIEIALRAEGADRERRRIRRAQRDYLNTVLTFAGWSRERVEEAVKQLDATTRVPRRGKRK